MVVIVGLDSSRKITFRSTVRDLQVGSLSCGTMPILVTVLKPLSGFLNAAILAQEVGAGESVAGVAVGVF